MSVFYFLVFLFFHFLVVGSDTDRSAAVSSTVDSRPRGRVTPRVAYDSPSLPTNGVLYRNSSEAASVGHLPLHYWTSTAGLADLNRADLIADLNHVKIASRIVSYRMD